VEDSTDVPDDEQRYEAAMLALAQKLEDVAMSADRLDVAAKADEIMALVRRGDRPGADKPDRDKASNTFVRILDGLGF
jgi:hypothetical protein